MGFSARDAALLAEAVAAGRVTVTGTAGVPPTAGLRVPRAEPTDLPELVAAVVAAVVAAGFPEPVPEYRFHPVRKWRFDLAWPALMVAFEREGLTGDPYGGRHQRRDGYAKDCEKYGEAAAAGWRVVRATGRQIEDGRAFRWLAATLGLRELLRELVAGLAERVAIQSELLSRRAEK